METTPINTILHEWHFDPDFSDGVGTAHAIPFEGEKSFSALVLRYVSDMPPGAMRATLLKAGVVTQDETGQLIVTQPFFYSRRFDEDFIRGLAFSMGNLGSTLAHNASVHQRLDISNEDKRELGRLERVAWGEHLTDEGIAQFKAWVAEAAPRFLEEGNHQIGEIELPKSTWERHRPRAIGVGVYYFEED